MKCRFCEAETGEPVLSLGAQPLANSFLDAEEVRAIETGHRGETRRPLDLHLCTACGLVQIAETVHPETMFSDYIYVSGTSDLIHRHAAVLVELAREVIGELGGAPVVEIASNDGTVLRRFREAGARVLGVEPARNVATLAEAAGIPTRVEFFSAAAGRDIARAFGHARLLLARHVFAHVPAPRDVLEGAREVIGRDGILMIESPYLEPFLTRTEFDTIYHEHLAYLSARPIARLLDGLGLELFDVRPFDIHGGSMLYVIGARGAHAVRPAVPALLAREKELGLAERPVWEAFAARADAIRTRLAALLEELGGSGARLAGYGAPAKGNTLLGCLDGGWKHLRFLVDRSPWKQGRFTPGTHLPVRPPQALLDEGIDHTLLLAWNFETEILEQQAEYRRRGGRFLRPIPWPEVIA